MKEHFNLGDLSCGCAFVATIFYLFMSAACKFYASFSVAFLENFVARFFYKDSVYG